MRHALLVITVGLSFTACTASAPAETASPEEQSSGSETEGTSSTTEPESDPHFVLSSDACETDADCVPAECCHAAACVAATRAPSCGDAMCTLDCRYGTLDCGGGCVCFEGRCAARLSSAPELPAPEAE